MYLLADQPRRSRRVKSISNDKSKALKNLRDEKSGKRKMMLKEDEDIYDIVEEEEYLDIVSKRREQSGWIVGDDNDYIDDGHEVFFKVQKETKSPKRKKLKDKNIYNPKQPSIKSMFASHNIKSKPSKKIEKVITLNDDENFENIMKELNNEDQSKIGKIYESEEKAVNILKNEPNFEINDFRQFDHNFDNVNNKKDIISNTIKRSNVVYDAKSWKIDDYDVDLYFDVNGVCKVDKIDEKSENMNNMERVSNPEPVRDENNVECSNNYNNMHDDFDNTKDIKSVLEPVLLEGFDVLNVTKTDKNSSQLSCFSDLSGMDSMEVNLKSRLSTNEPLHLAEDNSLNFDEEESINFDYTDSDSNNENVDYGEPLNNEKTEFSEDGTELTFYWFDMYEPKFKMSGTLYMFGKTEQLKSVCVIVPNVQRVLYFFPRKYFFELENGVETNESISTDNVMKEIKGFVKYSEPVKFLGLKSDCNYELKVVNKMCVFDDDEVGKCREYIQLKCGFNVVSFPNEGTTYSRVYGKNTSAIENFILASRLKGPSWVKIRNFRKNNTKLSICDEEYILNSVSNVEVLSDDYKPAPSFSIMSLALRHFGANCEIVSLGITVKTIKLTSINEKSHGKNKINDNSNIEKFCLFNKTKKRVYPFDLKKIMQNNQLFLNLELFDTESDLLDRFIHYLKKYEPDFIIGHDIYEYVYNIILNRMKRYVTEHWFYLGRIKFTKILNIRSNQLRGRVVCDTHRLCEESGIKCLNFSISGVVQFLFSRKFSPFSCVKMIEIFKKQQSHQLINFARNTVDESEFSLRVLDELNGLELAFQITKICGNLLYRTLSGGRSERNEYLLLHAFYKHGYILPDSVKVKSDEKIEKYKGGLVFKPIKGFYDTHVLLVDYNSLYPSIIQEFNICFTTFNRYSLSGKNYDEIAASKKELAILPRQLRRLMRYRSLVKKAMSNYTKYKKGNTNDTTYKTYNIRQLALKLIANSMYGCLGASTFRFYAKYLAELITHKGRQILQSTKELVMNFDKSINVIYGDTDSLMIDTKVHNYEIAHKIGVKILKIVNKQFTYMSLGLDAVYKRLLLYDKKKRYSAVAIISDGSDKFQYKKEMKGLDIVKHTTTALSREAGSNVLHMLLFVNDVSSSVELIMEKLKNVAQSVNSGQVSNDKFIIHCKLNKEPLDYKTQAARQPHVLVALRYNSNSENERKLKCGDYVQYIICKITPAFKPLKKGCRLWTGYQNSLLELKTLPTIEQV
ncbi:DNA polymerase alpha catalytic subunit [Intoshia linei]|uniref:DNA polymerase n=1 Tax=Intoshia linei TaxID=1819745 RepID=A0A177B181_9BILA|nr:DNA polymerase alpha catalytic subunit [Intoshia linei]